jgi:hypothetical protein
MKKFTDIEQFRNVIRAVKTHADYKGKDDNGEAIYLHDQPYPTLSFRGTVKLHGTNSAIVAYRRENGDIEYEFQSRERVLSIKEDNAGFMLSMLNKHYQRLFDNIVFNDYCAIYGEWCGGNIQKTVALNALPKMFVIFAVKIDDKYQDMLSFTNLFNNEEGIYNILHFQHFYINIDFERPEIAQNQIIERTIAIETECPVGKFFGISGVGEGCVLEHINVETGERYIFKSKGEKHQNSKVKTLTTIDTEAVENMRDFVEYAVTENRMKQGVDKMIELGHPIELKSTGDFLRWVYNDVIKEEEDTIIKNQIDVKKLGGAISAKARPFWINYVNKIQ